MKKYHYYALILITYGPKIKYGRGSRNYGTKYGTIDIKIWGEFMGQLSKKFYGFPYKPYCVY